MKYYSEVLGKIFDSERECLAAERKHSERAKRKALEEAARKAEKERLEEVAHKAFNKFVEAVEALAEFVEKYDV